MIVSISVGGLLWSGPAGQLARLLPLDFALGVQSAHFVQTAHSKLVDISSDLLIVQSDLAAFHHCVVRMHVALLFHHSDKFLTIEAESLASFGANHSLFDVFGMGLLVKLQS